MVLRVWLGISGIWGFLESQIYFFITSLANKQAHGYCLTRSHFFVNDEDERFRLIVRAHPESL